MTSVMERLEAICRGDLREDVLRPLLDAEEASAGTGDRVVELRKQAYDVRAELLSVARALLVVAENLGAAESPAWRREGKVVREMYDQLILLAPRVPDPEWLDDLIDVEDSTADAARGLEEWMRRERF